MPEVLKVSAESKPHKVAGAIANEIRQVGTVLVTAIGAGAVNQAVKAIAIARGYIAPSGADLVATPGFSELTIDGNERTCINFRVEKR